ncbi:MAG TPA: site-specific integrase [Solirubrobacterales bacterium]|jgi:integrase|nr:site-specific integrase [Solirubrobacterales bacterium]
MARSRQQYPAGKGFLHVRAQNGRTFYEARWRDLDGAQRRKRLGPAWVERTEDGKWRPRRGRPQQGFLDERLAYPMMADVIDAHEEELARQVRPRKEAFFPEVVEAWLVYLETEKRVKPSTLSRYMRLVAWPQKDGDPRRGRIMAAFGKRRLFEITVLDARAFLSMLDREKISARTVNVHRETMHAIFEFARREDAFGVPSNPFAATKKRPEEGSQPIDTFEADEIIAVAETARAGLHRQADKFEKDRSSAETAWERRRLNEQDAALFVIAACTGLRLGELRALRWRDVDLRKGLLSVSRSFSDQKETSTKSRRSRTVPLADQAIAEFRRLRRRTRFTGRDDIVFCRADGGPLGASAARERFVRAQQKAGLRVRRFHDLRHTFGSLAIREFDVRAVKEMMGHASLTTTERYLHSKPRPGDSAKLTSIFATEDGRRADRPKLESHKHRRGRLLAAVSPAVGA